MLPPCMEELRLPHQREQDDVQGQFELAANVRSIEHLEVALDLIGIERTGAGACASDNPISISSTSCLEACPLPGAYTLVDKFKAGLDGSQLDAHGPSWP